MRQITVVAVPLLLLWSAAGAQADAIQVGAFTGSDSISWAQLPLGQLPNPQTVTTVNGNSVNVTSNAVDPIDGLYRFEEGSLGSGFFIGDFAIGEDGIGVPGTFGEILTLDFATPVTGVGAQIQPDFFGNYTAQLVLFDSSLNPIGGGPFIVTAALGQSGVLQDDTNPFLGAVSGSANISRAVFAIIAHDIADEGEAHFGVFISGLQIDPTTDAVPEPVSLSLLGLGLAGYAWHRRRAVR